MLVSNYIPSKTDYGIDCEMLELVWQNAVREHGVVGDLLLEILPTFLNVWLFNSIDGLDNVHFAIQGNVYCTKLRANQMFLMWQCNSLLRETLNEYECIVWTAFDDSHVDATIVQSTVTQEDV